MKSTNSKNELSQKIGVELPASVDHWVRQYRSDWGFEARNPALPVNSLPGSAQRIIDYRRRVTLGQPLFIAGDRVGARSPLAFGAPATGHRIVCDGNERRGSMYHSMFSHRYLRWYRFSANLGQHIMFIGFRPNDSFDRQAAAWSIMHGMHRCSIVNLYGALTGNIHEQPDPIGDLTDVVIRHVCKQASAVICAWGSEDRELFDLQVIERAARLSKAIRKQRHQKGVLAFGVNDGQPIGIEMALPLIEMPKVEMEDRLQEDDDER